MPFSLRVIRYMFELQFIISVFVKRTRVHYTTVSLCVQRRAREFSEGCKFLKK